MFLYILILAGTSCSALGFFLYRSYLQGEFIGSVEGHPRALVIFDFDGTLCNSFPCLLHSLSKRAHLYGIKDSTAISLETMRDTQAKDLIKNLKIPFYKVPRLLYDFRKQWEQERHTLEQSVPLKPLLHYLQSQGYALGIVTSNSIKNVHYFLKHEELLHYFDFIGSCPSIFGKKHSLQTALKLIKKRPAYIAYIGDETRDVEAARAIKAQAIAVTWGMNSENAFKQVKPDALCSSTADIINYLKRTHDLS